MTVEKNKRRQARLIGRLPDAEAFSTSSAPSGTSYDLNTSLYQRGAGGQLSGMVDVESSEASNGESGSADLLARLNWEKNPDAAASHYREGISEHLFVEGLSYPKLKKHGLVPIGLSARLENATLRLSGGNLPPGMADVVLSVLPTRVVIAGPNPNQVKLKIKPSEGTFEGSFRHPTLQETVPFQGAFQAAFGDVPGEGRGNFLGRDPSGATSNESGSVRILVIDR